MIRSNLCDYSDAYIVFKGTITVPNTAAADEAVNNTNKKVIFKNCATFTGCITKINNTKVDDAQETDIVMSMYNLIEYSDAYSNFILILNQEVHSNTIEMNQLYTLMAILLIFLLTTIIVLHSNLNSK